jgi:hypothetical protein
MPTQRNWIRAGFMADCGGTFRIGNADAGGGMSKAPVGNAGTSGGLVVRFGAARPRRLARPITALRV